MVEDKKEETADNIKASSESAEAAQGKAEAKAEPLKTPSASPEQGKQEEKKTGLKTAEEKPSNCAGCNKSIKKRRWYYRNGKYYCTKKCWRAARKKDVKQGASV